MTNQLRSFVIIVKLISIQPIGTEDLLFKVLMIDRVTEHVVKSTWPGGLQVALKLWACVVLHLTFFRRLQEINCLVKNLPVFL